MYIIIKEHTMKKWTAKTEKDPNWASRNEK